MTFIKTSQRLLDKSRNKIQNIFRLTTGSAMYAGFTGANVNIADE